jgi:tight adherence protein C
LTRAVLLAAAAGALAAPAVVEVILTARVPRPGVGLLARIGRSFGWRAPRGLADRIAAAGLETPARDVMAVKVGSAVAALAAALIALPVAPGRSGALMLAGAPAAAYFAPDAGLRRRARRRARGVEAELADVLDLLRVAVAAGLTPGRALAEVGRRHPGVLARELARASAHAALGVPRADTYAELNRRAPAPGIPALVAALDRADRHGAPLAPALTAEAKTARARQAQRAAEQAAHAAPQIQLVVALLLVPAVLLLVAAALLPAIVPA